jgi:lanosterol synthase
MQAILSAPDLPAGAVEPLRRAYRFLSRAQLTVELPDYRKEGRDSALGGWCFSDGAHRWPVSDCTAEALSAVLAFHDKVPLPAEERIPDARLQQAAAFILSRQNADGGFGTYERRRASGLLELINPSEMYGACMTELSYLECTGSCVAALAHFRAAQPEAMAGRLDRAVAAAVRFLRRRQHADGAWPGFWGVHFTYGIFHAVKGLRAASVPPGDAALQRAADWLVRHQRPDGGWGEHYTGCLTGRYVEHPHSLAVQTSWALLTLLEILDPGAEPIRRGVAWLRGRQLPDGAWRQDAVTGVFFGTAMLDYRLYPAYFPTWALARHAALTS